VIAARRIPTPVLAVLTVVALVLGMTVVGASPARASTILDEVIPVEAPTDVAISPDGEYALIAAGTNVEVMQTATNVVVDIITLTTNSIGTIVWAPDGSRVYITLPQDNSVQVLLAPTSATPTFENSSTIGIPAPRSLAVSPDSATLFIGTATSVIAMQAVTLSSIREIGAFGNAYDLEVSADGGELWVGLDNTADAIDDRVRMVDLATDTITSPLDFPDGLFFGFRPRSVELHPDGDIIVGAINETTVVEFDSLYRFAPAGTLRSSLELPGSTGVGDVEVDRDGTIYATANSTGGVAKVVGSTITVQWILDESGTVPGGIAASPTAEAVYKADPGGRVVMLGDPARRLTGTNRFETAVEISQAGFPAGADIVYVATGTDFPDALAAGPAAGFLNGPVLLTNPTALPAAVQAEIVRLDPERIVVVGGPTRVSPAIEATLSTIATTDRITGTNRFETSRLIALDAFGLASAGAGADVAYIATGLNFPDALAAGAAGAALARPVILVDGRQPSIDAATENILLNLGISKVIVVGGPNMVSDGILAQLAPFDATRLAGINRFETATAINGNAYGSLGSPATHRAILATGLIFPDALAASALAGQIGAPLYLTPGTCVPASVLSQLTTLGVTQVTIVGGPDRVTQAVMDLTSC
jgi:putative cell wall-binding protein